MTVFHPHQPITVGKIHSFVITKSAKIWSTVLPFPRSKKLSKHRKSAGHVVAHKHSPTRNCTNAKNYVQLVKKILLELASRR